MKGAMIRTNKIPAGGATLAVPVPMRVPLLSSVPTCREAPWLSSVPRPPKITPVNDCKWTKSCRTYHPFKVVQNFSCLVSWSFFPQIPPILSKCSRISSIHSCWVSWSFSLMVALTSSASSCSTCNSSQHGKKSTRLGIQVARLQQSLQKG